MEKIGIVGKLMQCVIIVLSAADLSENVEIIMVSDVTEETESLGMWNSSSTKLLLTKYMQYLPHLGKTFSLKTKKMFVKIASEMMEAIFPFTWLQC